MAIDTFKKEAIVLQIIDERQLNVQMDGKNVTATISNRVKSGEKEISVGDTIIVVTNPYDTEYVRVHKDTWKNPPL